MTPIFIRVLRGLGACLAFFGAVIVVLRLYDESVEIDLSGFGVSHWLVLLGLAIAYGLANSFLALAWRNLLTGLGTVASRRWAIRVYGLSQVAKYLPGNVFHLAGRQALGMAAGVPGWSLAKSTAWELGLIAATGALFGLLALPLVVPEVSVSASVVLWLLFAGSLASLLRHLGGSALTSAFGLQLSFLVVSGLVFVVLVRLVAGDSEMWTSLAPAVAGAYVVAWLAGLVTPGAPAGVGVRELVLLLLLSGVLAEADVLKVVVLGRLVTVSGDFGFFAAAILIRCDRLPLGHAR